MHLTDRVPTNLTPHYYCVLLSCNSCLLHLLQVNNAYRSGMVFSVIDERMGSYPSECVEKFVTLALKCCQEDTNARPSMAEVVRELERIWLMMPESDTRSTNSSTTDPGKVVSAQSSSSTMKTPYISSEVSGSDLVSGVIPTITPRWWFSFFLEGFWFTT